MKKLAPKVLLIVIAVFVFFSSNILFARNGDVLKDKVTISSKDLSKINSVALVSVYGECFLRGRRVQLYNDSKYAALEDFIREKVSFVKNNTLNSNPLPFQFLDEQSVLASEQYQMILKGAQKDMGTTYAVDVTSLFKKKDDKDKEVLKEVNPWAGYYYPQDYGVYLANPLNQTINFGDAPKEKERIFREMGCDAIYTIGIRMTVVGLGGNVFGKESGKVAMEILANVEMPNGKKPYTVVVQVESDADTMFRAPLLATNQEKEVVIETVMRLSDQAWNLAWDTLNQRLQKALEKYQKENK